MMAFVVVSMSTLIARRRRRRNFRKNYNYRSRYYGWSSVTAAFSLAIYCCCFNGNLLFHQASADPLPVELYSNSVWRNPGSFFADILLPNRVLIPRADAPPPPEVVATLGVATINQQHQQKPPKMTVIDKKRYDEEILRKWPESDAYVRKKFQVWRSKIIPYEIDHQQFPVDERKVILSAIAEVEANSCIRFVKRTNETDYVRFLKNEPGCFSHVGHQGGEQWVNLSNDSACVRHALVVHELMHVLGWFHEHSRPDRDKFIKIFWHNILEEYKDNFRIFDDDQIFDVGLLAYDYHSVTHYHSGAFSRFGLLPTLTNWQNRQMTLGNSRGLSPGDVQKLRRGYACGNAESQPKFVVLLAGRAAGNHQTATMPILIAFLTTILLYK